MTRTRRLQISIRALLIAAFMCQLAVVAWINRPSGTVTLRVDAGRVLHLDGNLIDKQSLAGKLTSKLRWHSIWAMECELVISAEESYIVDILDLTQ